MAFDRDGLSLLWDRIRMYVAACVMSIGTPDIATSDDIGLVKPDGDTITIESDGTLHGADQTPTATTEVAGKVKPDGTTITVDEDGTIHGNDQVPLATISVPGKVMPDGSTITIDQDGTIHGSGQGGGTDVGELPFRVGYVGNSSYMSSVAYIIGDESDGVYRFPTVKTVPSSAFMSVYTLRSIDLPLCTSVRESAFYACRNLATVSLPSCTEVGTRAFQYCYSLKSVDLPQCSYVRMYAFASCYTLSAASLPKCRYVDDGAFSACSMLTRLDLRGVSSVPTLGTGAFYGTPIGDYSTYAGQYGSIYVPSSLYSRFRSAYGWSQYSSRIVSA